jgi:hypothetical protein
MVNFIKEVCEKIGPRSPCSKEEEHCAQFMVKRLKKFCDEAWIDDFYCRPGAYRAMFHWPILFYIIAIPFFLFYPWISLILTSFVVIILVGNEIYNKEIIDPLFKKQRSTNVIAKIKPSKEKKAYSYFGTICKNYLMGQIIKDQKETNRKVSYEDMSESIEERPDMVYHIDDDVVDTSVIILKYLNELRTFIETENLNDNEVKLGYALIDLFENYESIFSGADNNKFNKNVILLSLREKIGRAHV